MEYAIESVALFNPSIVPALIQEGVPPGGIRFLMSLRAIGEGHLSSIVFRTGVIDAAGEVQLDPPGAYSQTLKATLPDQFRKSIYRRDLAAIGVPEEQYQADPRPARRPFHSRSAFSGDRCGASGPRIIGASGIDHRLR